MLDYLRRLINFGSDDRLSTEFTSGRMDDLPYRLRRAPGPCAPLLVYLHGAGGAGRDNRAQLRGGSGYVLGRLLESAPEACILAPQCPREEAWWSSFESPSRAGEALLKLVEKLGRDGVVDSARLYLIGISMGGHGVWDLGWRRPDLWAALMPVCGAVPVHRVPGLAKVPTWCFHGALDTEVPVEGSRRVVELLQEAGGVVRYSELPAVGHNCTREVFSRSDLLPWLMEQRLSKTAG